jgi:hypothetical protein
VIRNFARHVDGNRESYAWICLGLANKGGIDADEIATQIGKRTT